MSLDVSPKLLAEAESGAVREEDFVDTVRTSLPYAYDLIASLAGELKDGTAEFTDNQTLPRPSRNAASCCAPSPATPSAAAWNATSTWNWPSRTATGGYVPARARGGETYGRFTSLRSQVLNQSPEFRDC